MGMRSVNKFLTKAQKEWAQKFIPEKAQLTNALRIDNETVRITFLEKDAIKIILVNANRTEN